MSTDKMGLNSYGGQNLSKWTDPNEWVELLNGDACPICVEGIPRNTIHELSAAYFSTTEKAPMKGYCCLVFKRHAVELHELTRDEAALLMNDMQRVSFALQKVLRPVKLNYEIHGNTIPHLHIHFFPRYRGDPFENGPINPKSVTEPVYKAGEFSALVSQLLAILERA